MIHLRNSHRPGRSSPGRNHKEIIDELAHAELLNDLGAGSPSLPDAYLCPGEVDGGSPEKYAGIFKTNSEGNHPDTPNCFMFPLEKGGWRVFRFSPGVQEDETWTQDKEGWTTCYFNCKPNLHNRRQGFGRTGRPGKGGYVFNTVAEAKKVAQRSRAAAH